MTFRPLVHASKSVRWRIGRLRADQEGAVLVMGLFMGCLLVAALWYVIGVGDALIWHDQNQEAADAIAFSSAAMHARGMNYIAAINLFMAAITAVYLVLRFLQGFLHAILSVTGWPDVPPSGSYLNVDGQILGEMCNPLGKPVSKCGIAIPDECLADVATNGEMNQINKLKNPNTSKLVKDAIKNALTALSNHRSDYCMERSINKVEDRAAIPIIGEFIDPILDALAYGLQYPFFFLTRDVIPPYIDDVMMKLMPPLGRVGSAVAVGAPWAASLFSSIDGGDGYGKIGVSLSLSMGPMEGALKHNGGSETEVGHVPYEFQKAFWKAKVEDHSLAQNIDNRLGLPVQNKNFDDLCKAVVETATDDAAKAITSLPGMSAIRTEIDWVLKFPPVHFLLGKIADAAKALWCTGTDEFWSFDQKHSKFWESYEHLPYKNDQNDLHTGWKSMVSYAADGNDWMQVWAIELAGDYAESAAKAVAAGGWQKAGKDNPNPTSLYVAEAEFYYDCNEERAWKDCSDSDKPVLNLNWRARLRRFRSPDVLPFLANWLLEDLFNNDAVQERILNAIKYGRPDKPKDAAGSAEGAAKNAAEDAMVAVPRKWYTTMIRKLQGLPTTIAQSPNSKIKNATSGQLRGKNWADAIIKGTYKKISDELSMITSGVTGNGGAGAGNPWGLYH